MIDKDSSAPPSQHLIDYGALLSTAPEHYAAELAEFLGQELPVRWRDAYVATVARPTNIFRFHFRTFEYICDLYSGLEATGEVPYDRSDKDTMSKSFICWIQSGDGDNFVATSTSNNVAVL